MMCLGLGGRKAPEDEEADAAGDEEDDDEDDEEEEEEDEERCSLFNGESNRRLIAHGGRPYVLNAVGLSRPILMPQRHHYSIR